MQAGTENQTAEAEKEVEKAAEESVPETSNDPATTVADGEQSEFKATPEEVVKAGRELKVEVKIDDKKTEEQCENQPSKETKVSVTTGKSMYWYIHV